MKKRILSIILALTMVLGMVPFIGITAFAEAKTIDGSTLTWELTDGTLTIDGTGPIPDFKTDNDMPWNAATKSEITAVVIKSGVTGIGKYAFCGCTKITSVTIPSSVQSIGVSAFSGCTGLLSVTIPSSVQSIGASAFYRCTKIASVTIPSSVQSIGASAFESCAKITSVTIQSGVQSIGEKAFIKCALASVTIPASVESIGASAFYCASLKSVTFEGTSCGIGDACFSGVGTSTTCTLNLPAGWTGTTPNSEDGSWYGGKFSYTPAAPAHTHDFTDSYVINDEKTHTGVCLCNEKGEEIAHSFDPTTGKCVCGAYVEYNLNTAPTTAADGQCQKIVYDDEGNVLNVEDPVVSFSDWYLRTMVQYKKDETTGDYDIRFISMLNGDCLKEGKLTAYQFAGFEVTVGNVSQTLKTTTANSSFAAAGKEVKITDYSKEGDFFFLQNIAVAKDIVENDPTVTVTPFVTLMDGTTLTGDAVSFTLSDLK